MGAMDAFTWNLVNRETAATGQYLIDYLSQDIEDAKQDPQSIENFSEFAQSLEYFDEWRHKLVLSGKKMQGKYNKEKDQWVITSGLLASEHIYEFHKDRGDLPGGPWERTAEIRETRLKRIKCE